MTTLEVTHLKVAQNDSRAELPLPRRCLFINGFSDSDAGDGDGVDKNR
jgi:hypothetical protein